MSRKSRPRAGSFMGGRGPTPTPWRLWEPGIPLCAGGSGAFRGATKVLGVTAKSIPVRYGPRGVSTK